jgi:hypothetical protein
VEYFAMVLFPSDTRASREVDMDGFSGIEAHVLSFHF